MLEGTRWGDLAAPAVRRRPCEARKCLHFERSKTPISLDKNVPHTGRNDMLMHTALVTTLYRDSILNRTKSTERLLLYGKTKTLPK